VTTPAEIPGDLAAALIDRYALRRVLGRGGMATVYLAGDKKHYRSVALKVLLPGLAAYLGAERFLKEIQIAARLSHPHILPLHDSGEAGGFLYYVMPYVEGGSLRQQLEGPPRRALTQEQALAIAEPVADALTYAHRMGVLHRDIKPENILFQQGHPIVADFGIAKAVSTAGGANLTRTGFPVGTPGYMSPEQAAGLTELDEPRASTTSPS
jgi:serine/threonine-protein kinase